MSETAEEIAAKLPTIHMAEHMHGHGNSGMYVYGHTCVEYPRFTRKIVCSKRRAPEVVTFFVDGLEVPRDGIAAALAAPHDLAGIAGRLALRVYGSAMPAGQMVDGVLQMRCSEREAQRRNKSFIEFEGVPVLWIGDQPAAEGPTFP